MLEATDDAAALRFPELRALVPTPGKAARVRARSVERLLKTHRIRRIVAADALGRLRAPALTVAPGTTVATGTRHAAVDHPASVADRLLAVACAMLTTGPAFNPNHATKAKCCMVRSPHPDLARDLPVSRADPRASP
jgi:hypothetical protein